MSRFFLALLLAVPLAPVAAQDGPLFGLHTLPVSAIEVGVGGATAFAPTESPYSVQFNPALLADAGARPGLRFTTNLAPDAFSNSNLLIGSSAASIGLQTALAGYPLTIGLGGSYSELNMDAVPRVGPQGNPLGTYDTAERASGGGLGIGWDGPVHIRVGGAAFYRESRETPRIISDRDALGRDRVATLDIGTAVTYDVMGGPEEAGETAMTLRLTGGYAHRHIPLQTDYFERDAISTSPAPAPPPEADLVGASASVSLMRQFGRRFRFRVARADVRAETEWSGQNATRIGSTVTVFETLVVRIGQTRRDLEQTRTSAGLGLQLDGLLRAIGAATDNPRILAFGDRLTLRGDVARYDIGAGGETDYAGFTLGWR